MLAQLAGDAEGGGRGRYARTLPSFWAAKAALERQRQRQAAAAAAGARHRGADGADGDGSGGEDGGGRPGKRRRTDDGEAAVGLGEAAEVSSFR